MHTKLKGAGRTHLQPSRGQVLCTVGALLCLLTGVACTSSDNDSKGSEPTTITVADTPTPTRVQPVTRAEMETLVEGTQWAGWIEGTTFREGDSQEPVCRGEIPEACTIKLGSFSQRLPDDEAVQLCELVRSWAAARQPNVEVTVFDPDEQDQATGSSTVDCAVVAAEQTETTEESGSAGAVSASALDGLTEEHCVDLNHAEYVVNMYWRSREQYDGALYSLDALASQVDAEGVTLLSNARAYLVGVYDLLERNGFDFMATESFVQESEALLEATDAINAGEILRQTYRRLCHGPGAFDDSYDFVENSQRETDDI